MIICWSAFLVVFADSYMLMFIKCVILYIRKDIRCCWKSVEDIGKWERWYVNFDYEQFFIQHFIVKNKRERLQFELSKKSNGRMQFHVLFIIHGDTLMKEN